MRKSALLIVTLILLAATTAAQSPGKTMRLGGLFDLSSAAGVQWGVTEKNAFLMAIEDFRKTHPGVEVSYKIEDIAYSNEKSVTALQKLASVDGLRYFVGPTWEVFSAVMPLCESRKLVCMAPSFNNQSFAVDNLKYTFTFWFDDRGYGAAHAPGINSGGYQKLAVFGTISDYYDALVEGLLAELKVKPVFVERVNPGDRDFRSLIARVPQGVDAVAVFLLADSQAQSFYKQWSELRKERPDFFTDDALLYFDPPLDLKKLGSRVFYTIPDFDQADLERFEKGYQEKYGQKSGAFSGPVAYDATMILLECMRRFDPDTAAVSRCISETSDYPGLSGKLSLGGGHAVKGRRMKAIQY